MKMLALSLTPRALKATIFVIPAKAGIYEALEKTGFLLAQE
jgi:hypothetical protein